MDRAQVIEKPNAISMPLNLAQSCGVDTVPDTVNLNPRRPGTNDHKLGVPREQPDELWKYLPNSYIATRP
jgi:hypothetical protein